MQDSPRDQPTVVAVLCAFVRDHTNAATVKSVHSPTSLPVSSAPSQPPTDIQAALTVVASRNTAYDGSNTIVDFSGANLTGANLTGANLTGANLTAARLIDATLTGANLTDAIFANADLNDAFLDGAHLTRASLYDVDLSYASLSDANLTDADLFVAQLSNADLTDANLTHARLTGANLTKAELSGANLTDAVLTGNSFDVNLSGRNPFGANLTGADLSYAHLNGAHLTSANLTGTDLTYAYLNGANLTGANLTGANLTGANLTGADLTGIKGLRAITHRPFTGSTPASPKNLRRYGSAHKVRTLSSAFLGHVRGFFGQPISLEYLKRRESCNNGLKPRAWSVLLSCQPVVLETELVGLVECLIPGESVEFAAARSWRMRFEAPWTVDYIDSAVT